MLLKYIDESCVVFFARFLRDFLFCGRAAVQILKN